MMARIRRPVMLRQMRHVGTLLVLVLLAACSQTAGAANPYAKKSTGAPAKPQGKATRAPKPGRPETERREGFGAQTRGGEGGRVINVEESSEAGVRMALQRANKTSGVIIRFPENATIAVHGMLPHLNAANVTIEGNGATLDGTEMVKEVALLDVRNHDVVVRNLRLRNGYDNLRIQGDDAHDVFVTHVSSTGSRDDGISIGYGAHDVTVQWSFLAGNTRSVFCKYGTTTDISLHHVWIQKGWIRSPIFSGHIRADMRNVIVEDWGEWGSRFEDGATGNVVASLFVLSPYAASIGGKGDSALRFANAGPVFIDKNVFRGEAKAPTAPGGAEKAFAAPPVLTHDIDSMEDIVHAGAGCMPRDAIDRAYIAARDGWHVGDGHPMTLPSLSAARPASPSATDKPHPRDD